MEELKELLHVVSGLPTLALWALAAFFAYKVSILISLYGVIRFIAIKVHDMYVTRCTTAMTREVWPSIKGMIIPGNVETLLTILQSIRGQGHRSRFANSPSGRAHASDYIHESDVDWLQQAVLEKRHRDMELDVNNATIGGKAMEVK